MYRQWRKITACVSSQSRTFSTSPSAMTRTYAEAIASLNTLQSNFAVVDAIRKSGRSMNEFAIPEMIEWCQKIGYQPADFNKLNAIHIAGTKGKGSTAAFVSSILTQFIGQKSESPDGKTLCRIGLYTSPHLRFVRERIQINGQPLSEEKFAKYFFDVWDRLEHAAEIEGKNPKDRSAKPVYFRYLTLMAFHCYLEENVDTAIMECGIGGEYDSTNVLQKPTVTGITNLGIDHVGVLGATLPEIAWHKAGIMKAGSTCYTTDTQPADTKPVLEERATAAKSQLEYVEINPRIAQGELALGLQGDFQKVNASLGIAIAKDWLDSQGYGNASDAEHKIARGLRDVKWGGRCETRKEQGIVWCIDGGHTLDSIKVAGQWFAEVLHSQPKSKLSSPPCRYLIFNQQTRDAGALAKALHDTLAAALKDEQPFTNAIFCTNTTFQEAGFRPDLIASNTNNSEVEALTVQKQLAQTWADIDSSTQVEVVRTIEEAVKQVRAAASQSQENDNTPVNVLVTGSLHLVGGFLEVLESGNEATENQQAQQRS